MCNGDRPWSGEYIARASSRNIEPVPQQVSHYYRCYLPGYLPGVAPTRLEERRGPLFTTRQKTIGLNGMIHEETHPCISCSRQSTFETVQT